VGKNENEKWDFPTDSVVVSQRNVDTNDLITNFNAMGHSETQSKKTKTGFFSPLFYDRGKPPNQESRSKSKVKTLNRVMKMPRCMADRRHEKILFAASHCHNT
jgi:hypothetical protein